MKFRPLRIDYHARAQEIIITERDYNSRRAAQSLLSHRCSDDISPRHHHHHDDDVNEPFVFNDEDGENRKPSSSLDNDATGNIDHRKYHSIDTSKSNETRREGSIANVPCSSAHNGNQSITSVFGPTIPPSECILRDISPVTKGPIRGRLLPVPETIPAMGSIIGLHAKIGGDQFQRNNIFSSFEGDGESRQQQRSFIDDATMFLQSGYTTIDHHPMQIMDETNNINVEAMDTIELANAPFSPPYKLLRHEPDDLTKIQSLKSLQISNVADFANEVIKMMEPRRSSCPNTESELRNVVKERPTLSAKPMLTFTSCKMDKNDCFVLDKNELSLKSFYEDCHGGLDDFGNCPILQSRKLKPYAEDYFCIIRLDPDFDPSSCQSSSSTETIDSSGLALGDICSAAFVSQELALPSRLEHKNDVATALILQTSCNSKQKIGFVEDALNWFKESQMRGEAVISRFVRSDPLIGDPMSFPKKIALESDLSLYEDDAKPTLGCQSDAAIELPSFVQSLPFSCARKTKIHRCRPQKRYVDSSARVVRIDALSNICGPTKVASIYLPQIKVRDCKDRISQNDLTSPEKEHHLAPNDELISFARECVPSSSIPASIDSLDGIDLLQGQTSSYPILSWFTCDDDVDINEDELPDHVYVDGEARDLKRRTFCNKAVRVGDKERSRCVLLTGCSSRFKAAKYSYRGFLTNQIINPQIYQQRYRSMIEINKIYQRENMSALNRGSDGVVGPRQRSFYFSRMVVIDFADRFSAMMKKRKKKKQQQRNTRGPFAVSMKTSRHGDVLPLESMKKKHFAVNSGKQSSVAPELEYLSSSFLPKENISMNEAVERLGRDNLNVRGELLHLATKARDLREDEDAYLAELAVINRGREDNPSHDSFEDEICDGTDFSGDSGACGNGKREASDDAMEASDAAMEEHDKERKKKKRKRDKKKKEKKKLKKEKKSRKRKRRDDVVEQTQSSKHATEKLGKDGCDSISKCEESKRQSTSVKKLRIDAVVPSTNHKSWKVVPSIALGVTPVHRPKEKQSQAKPSAQMFETPKVLDIRGSLNTTPANHCHSSLEESKPTGKSPDSVVVTNLDHDALFTENSSKDHPIMQSQAPAKNNNRQQEDDSISAIATDDHKSAESFYHGVSSERTSEEKESTFTILTSESFLELFGESIMELASGRWFDTLTAAEKLQITDVLNDNKESVATGLDPVIPTRAKINVSDCPLLDIAGADIELADDKALIVQRISTLNQSTKEFVRRLVVMAASGRYRSIHVILCVDTDIHPSEIIRMQNALMPQSGCPCETVTFEYTSPRTLSSSIALQFYNNGGVSESSRISQFASDENVQERARFLICLVPTMTVHNALRCLCSETSGRFEDQFGGGTAMQTLLSLARDTSRELFPNKVSSMIPNFCAEQLWLAVNTASSFATRQC